jgi:hypothetical protein
VCSLSSFYLFNIINSRSWWISVSALYLCSSHLAFNLTFLFHVCAPKFDAMLCLWSYPLTLSTHLPPNPPTPFKTKHRTLNCNRQLVKFLNIQNSHYSLILVSWLIHNLQRHSIFIYLFKVIYLFIEPLTIKATSYEESSNGHSNMSNHVTMHEAFLVPT